MSEKRAFLVVGAEATGTKLITEILLAAGCRGDASNEQWLERALRDKLTFQSRTVVLRQSIPCGLETPDLGRVFWHFHSLGYHDIRVIVTVRDWWVTTQSHIHNQTHAFNAEHSEAKKQRAYAIIFQALAFSNLPYMIQTYEGMLMRTRRSIRHLCEWCELEIPDMELIPMVYDGNAKYFDHEARVDVGEVSDSG